MSIQELFRTAENKMEELNLRLSSNQEQKSQIVKYSFDKFVSNSQPLIESGEIIQLHKAYEYILDQANSEQQTISEDVIKQIHLLCFGSTNDQEAGIYRTTDVNMGSGVYNPPNPQDLQHFMEHFVNQMASSRHLLHPIEYASICHKRLLDIHPFNRGNHLVALLVMNLVLLRAGYCIVSIPLEWFTDFHSIYKVLRGNKPDIDPFTEFIAKCVVEAQEDLLKMI